MLHDDKKMNEELAKDEIAEQAFSRLTAAWDPQQQAVTDGEDREVREQLEALALLAYGLEPVAPSRDAEQRLLAAVNAGPIPFRRPESAPTPDVSPVASVQPAAAETMRRDPLDRTLQHLQVEAEHHAEQTAGQQPLQGHSADSEKVLAFNPRRASNPSSSSFATLALAAALAFCLIGLGYLYGQLNAKNAVIAVQADRLDAVPLLEDELALARDQLRGLNDQLAMVNTVARQAYPMRRVANSPGTTEDTFGRVFVCGQHQRWSLTVSGLEPAPQDQNYHLWFMTETGPVDAGVVEVDGGIAGLRDLNMPEDTSGFRLTLEPRNIGDQPSGNVILIGESPVSL